MAKQENLSKRTMIRISEEQHARIMALVPYFYETHGPGATFADVVRYFISEQLGKTEKACGISVDRKATAR